MLTFGTSAFVDNKSHQIVTLCRDDFCDIWIPEHQIGVRAHGDASFARVQVEDLGGVGAGHSHELILVHFSSYLPNKDSEIRLQCHSHVYLLELETFRLTRLHTELFI